MLTLADALEAITRNAVRSPNATALITEAAIDSRLVIPGSLFVAIPGEKVDDMILLRKPLRGGHLLL